MSGPIPKELGDKHFPELGNQFVIGLENVGVTVVDATLQMNTAATSANLVDFPPNVSGVPSNVIVHSLGAVPKAVFGHPLNTSVIGVGFNLLTADNSAVYLYGTVTESVRPKAVAMRFYIIR